MATPAISTAPTPVWFDAHLDLAMLAVEGRDMTLPLGAPNAGPADPALTLPSLAGGNVALCLGTLFVEPTPGSPLGYAPGDAQGAHDAALRQLALYRDWEARGLIRLVRSRADLLEEPAAAPLRVIVLMEGADPIRDPAEAEWWFDQGVRAVGLAWRSGSRYAGGDACDEARGGLAPAGRELVRRLDDLGVILDLSHLHDRAADEMLSLIHRPPMASHSSSRSLQGNGRMRLLSDAHASAIARRGGMIGLPLYSRFLHVNPGRAPLQRTLDHVDRLAELAGGRRFLGLGSDLDGGFGAGDLPEGIDRPADYERLAQGLRARGWSDAEVEGFRCGHWLRFWREYLASPR